MVLEGLTSEIENGKAFCQTLCQFFEKQKETFENQLIPDLSYINNIAECVTGIEIKSVEHHFKNQYTLNYKFDWTVYNGCSDLDEMGTIAAHISFRVENDGSVHFDCSPLDDRSTADEL
ncbi:hypothetical protein K0504_18225 [Neiella marina]|uniref:Uncharacterized protein n=1 Tax=Neiella holothuriorum TaxID=2870530 RepID=A0ABS7EKY3_9GAMM|nr:hypothetical protein [Neiella holothuriorum]MBW8192970.1 hypothetical protein [Neiella holothuriorum]